MSETDFLAASGQNLSPDLWYRAFGDGGVLPRFLDAFTWESLPFLLIALVPALIWLYIFWRRQHESKLLTAITFFGGMVVIIPIWLLQYEIFRVGDWIETLGMSVFAVLVMKSMWIGIYEETAKHWIVKVIDNGRLCNIDDAIEFSITAALGFAFFENIIYFHQTWTSLDPQVAGSFWFVYLFRSLGSMFLHVFASGIFGYYYGLAHFAQPVLQEKMATGKYFPILKTCHRILHLKSTTLFYEEKILTGLLLAAGLHGIFNLLMGLSSSADSDMGRTLWLVLTVPYLIGGFFWLTYLLDQKEDHKEYGHVTEERTSQQ